MSLRARARRRGDTRVNLICCRGSRPRGSDQYHPGVLSLEFLSEEVSIAKIVTGERANRATDDYIQKIQSEHVFREAVLACSKFLRLELTKKKVRYPL